MTSVSLTWIVVFAACASVFAVGASVFLLFRESRKTLALDRRLQVVRAQALSAWGEMGTQPEDTSWPVLTHLSEAFAGVVRIGAMLVPVGASERAKIGELLRLAGFNQPDALAIFLSLKMILALVAGVVAAILASEVERFGGHPAVIGFAGLAGAVMAGALPEVALRRLGTRRRNRLSSALPDALDLMVLCVEAGYTFERALTLVAQELRPLAPELAAELGAVESQLRLGADRKTVLQELYVRTACEGLRDFAMTVIQGERYGTPLGQSMRNIARNERTQRASRIETQAGRLPVVMSIPMLLFVVPGILLLMGGPAFMMALEALRSLSDR